MGSAQDERGLFTDVLSRLLLFQYVSRQERKFTIRKQEEEEKKEEESRQAFC